MKTVLLLGGRSFLGGHICRSLLTRGYRVLLQSSGPAAFRSLVDILPHEAVETVTCDLADHDRLRELLIRSQSVIYAAFPYHAQSLGQARVFRGELRSLAATLTIIAASGVSRLLFVSASGTCAPAARASQSWGHLRQKIAAEDMVLCSPCRAIVVNPTMCVGQHDTKPSTGEFFRFIARFPFLVLPSHEINIVDVEAAALGTVLALEQGQVGERYVLSGATTTMGALTRHIRYLAGRSRPIITMPRWLAVAAAYGLELANLMIRRARPAIPLVGIELIQNGSRGVGCDKAMREIGYFPGDSWAAVDRAFHWYVAHGILPANVDTSD